MRAPSHITCYRCRWWASERPALNNIPTAMQGEAQQWAISNLSSTVSPAYFPSQSRPCHSLFLQPHPLPAAASKDRCSQLTPCCSPPEPWWDQRIVTPGSLWTRVQSAKLETKRLTLLLLVMNLTNSENLINNSTWHCYSAFTFTKHCVNIN